MSDDEQAVRLNAWTVLVQVSADQPMPDYREFNAWMDELCATIGATRTMRRWEEAGPWVVNQPHGTWRTDHFGMKYLDNKPLANVWQRIEGVASKAMAMVWASIHLVDPLERAGYDVGDLNVLLTDNMVVLA